MVSEMRVTVLGGGSWGTTVASLAARNTSTTLWLRDAATAQEINEHRTNSKYLGEHRKVADGLSATADLEQAVRSADVLVIGVPTQAARSVIEDLRPYLRPWVPVISIMKGLELGSHLRPTEMISECLPGRPVGLLAGPNIAREVLDGMAAAAVLSLPDAAIAAVLQTLFTTPRFRVYRNSDLLGCEMGGILKNVVAIAAGMADGLGVGDNTRAMVLTRGLAEMTRLGVAMGAEAGTFAGLTGMGDLIATCTSPHSRNRRVGEGLAKGKQVAEIVEEMGQVAEGVKTATPVIEIAEQFGCPVPIMAEVEAVVNGLQTPYEAYRGLTQVAPGDEDHIV